MQKIYFDNSATTKVDREVLEAMLPYFSEQFGNPSSNHSFGQSAADSVLKARKTVGNFLGCEHQEAIFTSGATEANILALRGITQFNERRTGKKGHLIVSQIEHKAILEPAKELEKEGFKVTYLPVNQEGIVDLETLKQEIKEETVLISIMYANSEMGAIQPIKELTALVKEINLKRASQELNKIFVHTDAAQAVQYLESKVNDLGVDLMTIAGHKIYAPKGVGVLYIRKGVEITPQQLGGSQEYGLRAGTENVPYIVALAKALELVEKNRTNVVRKLTDFRDKIIRIIEEKIPNCRLNGPKGEKRLPNNINFCFPGAEGESMMLALDLEGIAVSTGSACSSHDLRPSHVLTAMGIPPEVAHSSIRISLGKYNTKDEVDRFLKVLPGIVERFRKIAPKIS